MSKVKKNTKSHDRNENPNAKSRGETEKVKKIQIDQLLEEQKKKYIEQIAELKSGIEILKKENERLKNQQEKTDLSKDIVAKLKKDLDRAKSTNNFLLEDVNDRKRQICRLEEQMFELNMRIEAATKKVIDIAKISEKRKKEIEELTQERDRALKFVAENNRLRKCLSTNHIDYKTGKPFLGMGSNSYQINSEPQKSKKVALMEAKLSKSLPESNRRYGRISKSLEDFRKDDGPSGSPSFEMDGKSPPAYMGKYTDILFKKQNLQRKLILASFDSSTQDNIRPQINLPPFKI